MGGEGSSPEDWLELLEAWPELLASWLPEAWLKLPDSRLPPDSWGLPDSCWLPESVSIGSEAVDSPGEGLRRLREREEEDAEEDSSSDIARVGGETEIPDSNPA